MNIYLQAGREDPIRTTLAAFLAENDLDPAEVGAINQCLGRGRPYLGGGGAAVEWGIWPIGRSYKGWRFHVDPEEGTTFIEDQPGQIIDVNNIVEAVEFIDHLEAERHAFNAGPYSTAQCERRGAA